MRRVAVTFLLLLCALVGCASAEPAATRGAAALGERLTTMDEVVDWMRENAGGCAEVTRQDRAALRGFVDQEQAARLGPHVAEWVTCAVSDEFPMVGLVLFEGDAQRKFQESWHDAMTGGEVAEGPTFAFGNGFAISAGTLGVNRLGLHWFRCGRVDPKIHQIPADEAGCVFANEHGHRAH